MHIYTIGYTTPEGGESIEITHETKLTNEALDALVKSVLPEAARRHIAILTEKERKRWQHPPELFDPHFIAHARFADIYQHVVPLLIEQHGFQKLEQAASFSVFGLPDLLVRGDWGGDPSGNDAQQAGLTEILADAGLPVVSLEERDAQEEARLAAIAPYQLRRRALRLVDRMQAAGRNPFKTDDIDLILAILAAIAGRALTAAEEDALTPRLPPFLETQPEPEPAQLAQSWQDEPALADLAAMLAGITITPPVARAPVTRTVKPVDALPSDSTPEAAPDSVS